MKFTSIIEHAIFVSAHIHRKHERVGLDVPYIVHPFSVALILSEYTKDENIIVAGLLHDVIEDDPHYTFDLMEKDFNKQIADIVMHISEKKCDNWGKPYSWERKKKHYLEALEEAPKESLMVSAADTINNLDSLLLTYKLHDNSIWKKFGADIKEKMRFYGCVIEILDKRLKGEMATRAKKSYILLEKNLRK